MKHADELKTIVHQAIDLAVKAGADAAYASVSSSQSSEIKLEKHEYHLQRSQDSSRVYLNVHKNQCSGSAQTNDVSETGLRDAAKRALEMAAVALPDPHLALSTPGDYVKLDLKNERLTQLKGEEFSDIAKKVFEASLVDPEFSIDSGNLICGYGAEALANTNGVSLSDESTSLVAVMMGIAKRGEEVTSYGYDYNQARSMDHFVEDTIAAFDGVRAELKTMLKPQRIDSYRGAIILLPDIVDRLLLNTLIEHAHGDMLKDNASKWADMLGKSVASPLLTIMDDPHNLDYMGATSYDSAGTATRPTTLIDRGVLQFFMESVDSASRRGTKTTGHENRLSVIRLKGGEGTIFDLAKLAGKPVLAVKQFSGNINSITGDFSGVAKNSHLIVNGERIPVTETMIAGNVFEMANHIMATGTAKNWRRSLEAPPILIDGVSVSAGS